MGREKPFEFDTVAAGEVNLFETVSSSTEAQRDVAQFDNLTM